MTPLTHILAAGKVPFLPYGLPLRPQVQQAVNQRLVLDALTLQPSVWWEAA